MGRMRTWLATFALVFLAQAAGHAQAPAASTQKPAPPPKSTTQPLPKPPAKAAPEEVTPIPTGPPFNPELLTTRWQARWIRPQGVGAKDFGVYHLRKSFTLAAVPKKFVVNVTADNRYELFVNGTRLRPDLREAIWTTGVSRPWIRPAAQGRRQRARRRRVELRR